MSLSILTNISAMTTQQNLLNSSNAVAKSMQRLSSGLRLNSAADDAAGYAISEGLTAQTNGLGQAASNTNDATSMVQTASSSLTNIQSMLQRVRELAVQYANGSIASGSTAATAIQSEVDALTSEIGRQRGASSFNTQNLLNGTAGTGVSTGGGLVTFQVGANKGDIMTANFTDVNTGLEAAGFSFAAGVTHAFDLSQAPTFALQSLDSAINSVSGLASSLGAVQNRLQYASDSINSTETNLAASNSQIKDVNMASEMTHMTQQQILSQAGTAMLAQANSQPQLILKLIG